MQNKAFELIALNRAYKVDEEINTREKHLVIVRFGRAAKPEEETNAVNKVDKWLKDEAETFKDDVKVFTVEMSAVPELVARYKLSEPYTILFFSKNVQVKRLHATSQEEIKETIKQLVNNKNAPATAAAPMLKVERISPDPPTVPAPPPGKKSTSSYINNRRAGNLWYPWWLGK